MHSLLLQVRAVTLINLKSIPQRFWLSLSTVVAVALVVVVLLAFLSMANGFRRTLAGSGAEDVAVIFGAGRSRKSTAPCRASRSAWSRMGPALPVARGQALGIGGTLPRG